MTDKGKAGSGMDENSSSCVCGVCDAFALPPQRAHRFAPTVLLPRSKSWCARLKKKRIFPPTPPIREKEVCPSPDTNARAYARNVSATRRVVMDEPGPENLHAKKIMERLKIKATRYYELREKAEKNIV